MTAASEQRRDAIVSVRDLQVRFQGQQQGQALAHDHETATQRILTVVQRGDSTH